jgi:rhodanese-related sulfurtransferase
MVNDARILLRKTPRPVLLYALALAGLLAATGGCQRGQVSDRRIEVITLAQAVDYHERSRGPDAEVLFVDARRSAIYDAGHIAGAENLRPNDVDLRVGRDPRLEAKEALIVYGQDPGSGVARAMAKRLIEAGYNTMLRSRVKFFPGGYNEWLATGLPVDLDEPAPPAPD